jgi:hypothetical protein
MDVRAGQLRIPDVEGFPIERYRSVCRLLLHKEAPGCRRRLPQGSAAGAEGVAVRRTVGKLGMMQLPDHNYNH